MVCSEWIIPDYGKDKHIKKKTISKMTNLKFSINTKKLKK